MKPITPLSDSLTKSRYITGLYKLGMIDTILFLYPEINASILTMTSQLNLLVTTPMPQDINQCP